MGLGLLERQLGDVDLRAVLIGVVLLGEAGDLELRARDDVADLEELRRDLQVGVVDRVGVADRGGENEREWLLR